MIKILKVILPVLLLLTSPSMFVSADIGTPSATTKIDAEKNQVADTGKLIDESITDLRGVWVASVVNIDYPTEPASDSEVLKNEALTILDNAADMGMNTIFLQVRPTSDALYKSQIFPWSKYLTGAQGVMPSNGFDPLAFWVDEAHKRGMQLHAWINPYRITKRETGDPAASLSLLDPKNPATLNPSWVVKHSDSNLYFDPGIPEVRKLVVNGVLEIIENYQVDGIHLDDYFYPGKNFNDSASFKKYGKGFINIDDWRRDNVNALVKDLSTAIRSATKRVSFGISPFGIWANKKTNSLGSDTNGLQTYYDHYADTLKWVKEGTLDYIAPQIYWNIGYNVADYSKLLDWWKNAVKGTGTSLYIGHAAYKAGNSSTTSPWYGISEIPKQLQLNEKVPEVKGSIFFSYKSFKDNPSLAAAVKAYYEILDGNSAGTPVLISRPSANIQTKFTQFYLNGSSDPNKPLYLNGIPVEGRSPQGYFGILVQLAPGPNSFTLSQEGSYSNRVIFRDNTTAAPTKMSSANITASSVFPQSQESRLPGEKITLSCLAPAGSKVTVKIGGKTYNMVQSGTAPGSGLYAAKFTYSYTIPAYTGTPRNIDIGAPVYTMNYKGTIKSRTAPAKITAIMKGSPYYATVANDVIDTYNTPVSGNGSSYELYKGMTDYVTGITGSYARLASGQWVFKSSVSISATKNRIAPEIKKALYETGVNADRLKLDITASSTALAAFDGTFLKLTVSPAAKSVTPKLPTNSMFSEITVAVKDNIAVYTLKLKANQRIEGFHVEKTASGATLNIKRPVYAKEGTQPLSGISIMIDPGHGGNESGAAGPLGLKYAEKAINLNIALKLQKELTSLGAKVIMTRTEDTTLSLGARLAASRAAKPDMFISVHSNSMEDNVDISKVAGFSVHYRETFTQTLSETILNKVKTDLGRIGKGIHKQNFYVTRGTWAPSLLLECGFVPNPNEFEWLTSDTGQAELAATLAGAVVDYFKK